MESSVWVSFGQWLREERLKQRLSVEEAAARAGYSRQQWDKLEKGQTGTKRERIPLIALAIGKPPDAKTAGQVVSVRRRTEVIRKPSR